MTLPAAQRRSRTVPPPRPEETEINTDSSLLESGTVLQAVRMPLLQEQTADPLARSCPAELIGPVSQRGQRQEKGKVHRLTSVTVVACLQTSPDPPLLQAWRGHRDQHQNTVLVPVAIRLGLRTARVREEGLEAASLETRANPLKEEMPRVLPTEAWLPPQQANLQTRRLRQGR